MPNRITVTAAITAVFLTAAAFAHEYWIQPDSFRPPTGATVSLRLMVGDGFPGEHRTRNSAKFERFDLLGPDWVAQPQQKPAGDPETAPDPSGKPASAPPQTAAPTQSPKPIQGKDGDDPAGTFTAEKPGLYTAVYRSKETLITLEADKFNDYLREDGLDNALKARTDSGKLDTPGREAYSRCAKALLCAGGSTVGPWDANAGLVLEIIPAANPYGAHAGQTLTFTLLESGQPRGGALMAAITMIDGKSIRTTARTNASGQASFELKTPGLWLINAVRMHPAKDRDDLDWVSTWSSLTFDLAPAPAAPVGASPGASK